VLASASRLSAHPIPHGTGMEGGASRSFLKEDFVKEAHPPSNGFPTAKFSASGRDLLPCLAPALLAVIGKGPSSIKNPMQRLSNICSQAPRRQVALLGFDIPPFCYTVDGISVKSGTVRVPPNYCHLPEGIACLHYGLAGPHRMAHTYLLQAQTNSKDTAMFSAPI
jgi:hypothetical protein